VAKDYVMCVVYIMYCVISR